ncbi:hypothetical protein BCON_0441g00050 [Botryotinia convoluta]|uniref:Uncharacterized protein n=1 Tax=Botryotinia convoluta TaxID=54673 RepID=A0A4Z1HIL1_9HELO|nr:hypothetical protein BCON_0441g00050 [Botryotinia convoluta]
MSFHGSSSSSHKEPQADGSQVKDTNLDQASSGPSVMMGEESKDNEPTENKSAKKKRERKHRQGFYNRDRRIVRMDSGKLQVAKAQNKMQQMNPIPTGLPIPNGIPMHHTLLHRFRIATSATTTYLYSYNLMHFLVAKYHPDLVAKEGWGDRRKGSLELYHETFESSAEIKDNTLQLVDGETAETFLTLLKKARQVRHCVFRRGCCIDMPIIIVELMLQDAIRLTRMVGGQESLSMLEKFRSRLAREIALNEDVKVASDRLKSMFKKEELDMNNTIQVRAIRAQRVELDHAIEQKKRQLEVVDDQFADEVESEL